MQKISEITKNESFKLPQKRRLDVLVNERDKDGNTHWVRVGFAIPSRNQNGYSMRIHLLDRWFILRESLHPVPVKNNQKTNKESY